jgi:SP family general alpha glucoside:H+ symporter-like MFS transporter
MPQSPWYLVRVGRYDAAKHSLSRLSSDADPVEHERTVALMQRTTNLEMEMFKGASYWDCFRGTNLRRTEIACIAFASQVTDGGALVYSPTYFFEQAVSIS